MNSYTTVASNSRWYWKARSAATVVSLAKFQICTWLVNSSKKMHKKNDIVILPVHLAMLLEFLWLLWNNTSRSCWYMKSSFLAMLSNLWCAGSTGRSLLIQHRKWKKRNCQSMARVSRLPVFLMTMISRTTQCLKMWEEMSLPIWFFTRSNILLPDS